MKTIIKNNDNSKAVNKRREDINGEQIENSQSKVVKKKDIVKQAEEKATYRDYSGKIRFGDSEKPVPDDTKAEKSDKAFDKVKKAKHS